MPPQLAIFILQELIAQSPAIFAELQALFSKSTPPTLEEWEALRAKVRAKSYRDYVPATALPAEDPAQIALPIKILPAPAPTKAPESASVGAESQPTDPNAKADADAPAAVVLSSHGEAVREQSLGSAGIPPVPDEPAKPA